MSIFKKEPKLGDVVEVIWRDSQSFHNPYWGNSDVMLKNIADFSKLNIIKTIGYFFIKNKDVVILFQSSRTTDWKSPGGIYTIPTNTIIKITNQ